MKKGFTLIELVGIVAVLGILAIIVMPEITKNLRASRDKAYQEQIKLIESAAEKWGLSNTSLLPNSNDTRVCIELEELKREGLLEKGDIINPKEETVMNGSIDIIYEELYNNYTYTYNEAICSKSKYALRVSEVDTNYIKVVVNYQGATKYKYKLGNNDWIESNNSYYTFQNLSANQSYQIQAKVVTATGEIDTEKITVTTSNVRKPNITVRNSTVNPNGKEVEINIYQKVQGVIYRYRINNGEWIPFDTQIVKLEITNNNTNIYVEVLRGEETIKTNACTITDIK